MDKDEPDTTSVRKKQKTHNNNKKHDEENKMDLDSDDEDLCPICFCEITLKKKLCLPYTCEKHAIHAECFLETLKHECSLRCPLCRSHINMAGSLQKYNLPPLEVMCGYNSVFAFPDGIFTMSLAYRTPDGRLISTVGNNPLIDFGTVAVKCDPITKGRWYFEAQILNQNSKRKSLAWQPGWANTEFKVTESKSQVLGLALSSSNEQPLVFGRLRQNAYQGCGDCHEGNSWAYDPIP
eukprot:UN23902